MNAPLPETRPLGRSAADSQRPASGMLRGQQVVLRAPQEDDLPLLAELRNDVELQTLLMSVARPNSTARVREWLEQRGSDPHGLFFVVARRASGAACGFIQALRIDALHGHAWLGVCLARDAQGGGLGGEALALLEDYLVDRFRLRKVMLEALAANRRAIEFYRRAGFESVGVWRRHFYADGQFHDVQIMEKHLRPPAAEAAGAQAAARPTSAEVAEPAARHGLRTDSAHAPGGAR